jgi:ppGpp synthetase/RelA/SpoT-type nucleotidyltranferase
MSRESADGSTDTLLAAYDAEFPRYEAFAHKVRGLVEEIIGEHRSRVLSVTGRVKLRTSFAKKVSGKEYPSFSDVTDICGVRIITYFEGDVDVIASLVEEEFEIDRERSVDKRVLLDPDRFGYLSLHLVAKLSSTRIALAEYKRFDGLKVEIQIRTILQHAWAEIEHDLGYKTELVVPREVRRKFSRLAGLLEIADQGFAEIRSHLQSYEDAVSDRIEHSPQAVSLDRVSFSSFITNNGLAMMLDFSIAELAKANLNTDIPDVIVEAGVARLSEIDITTIGQLEASLVENQKIILEFAREFLGGETYSTMSRGVCTHYLFHVVTARAGYASVRAALGRYRISDYGDLDQRAARITNAYARAVLVVS